LADYCWTKSVYKSNAKLTHYTGISVTVYNADNVIDIDNSIITVLAFSAEDKNTPLSRRYKENRRCGAKKLLKMFPNQRLTF